MWRVYSFNAWHWLSMCNNYSPLRRIWRICLTARLSLEVQINPWMRRPVSDRQTECFQSRVGFKSKYAQIIFQTCLYYSLWDQRFNKKGFIVPSECYVFFLRRADDYLKSIPCVTAEYEHVVPPWFLFGTIVVPEGGCFCGAKSFFFGFIPLFRTKLPIPTLRFFLFSFCLLRLPVLSPCGRWKAVDIHSLL